MTTNADIGYTTTFQLWNVNAGPAAYYSLQELTSVSMPKAKLNVIDATNMLSPGGRTEIIVGLTDSGECSIEMNYVPGSATDNLINAVLASKNATSCKITLPNGHTATFDALCSGYDQTVPVNNIMKATATFSVTGDVTYA